LATRRQLSLSNTPRYDLSTMALVQRSSSLLLLLLCLLAALATAASAIGGRKKRLTRRERESEEAEAYAALRKQGQDEVSHTAEAAALRSYQLRKKKRKGLLRKKETSLADVLFPGVAPELYRNGEDMFIITDTVQSKKTHLPFEFYDLPGCPPPVLTNFRRTRRRHARKNLGARLQGMGLKPAPYNLKVKQDAECTAVCEVELEPHQIRWLRKLVERQYRIHLQLDQLPVLMRSSELNYAVRGYPVGFKAPPAYTGLDHDEYYLYNHLKFTITYQQDTNTDGVYITGFDVHPVSIEHKSDGSTCGGGGDGDATSSDEEEGFVVENDPSTYLALRMGGKTGNSLHVIYSYEVEWIKSDLPWSDRWDVYLYVCKEGTTFVGVPI
jgi:transmembrane 9 superfamily protein 2/4